MAPNRWQRLVASESCLLIVAAAGGLIYESPHWTSAPSPVLSAFFAAIFLGPAIGVTSLSDTRISALLNVTAAISVLAVALWLSFASNSSSTAITTYVVGLIVATILAAVVASRPKFRRQPPNPSV